MRRSFFGLLVATTFVTANAFADEDVETLVKQLDQEHTALSTQDCVTACKALASIRRAAEKICGLEAGPRCIDARSKADDAQRRVQAACPDCQIAAAKPKDDERRASKKGAPEEAPTTGSTKNAPPAESSRGGCASCSTPGDVPTGDVGVLVVAGLALARRLRSRARARSRSMS